MSNRVILSLMLIFTVLLAACARNNSTALLQEDCPVTEQQDPPFQPPDPYPPDAPSAGTFWYGTSELWTMVPEDGVWWGLAQTEPDGRMHWTQKVFIWRDGYDAGIEPIPALTLRAVHLADPELTYEAPKATHASQRGGWSMLTGVELPSSGCWQFTAVYQGHELTFVVWLAPE
ncbi:MAG: hypothetical protein OEV06_12420 [Anaerolineae bacterium]|nr:hypothetical protein [Anaerolineae bacterium]